MILHGGWDEQNALGDMYVLSMPAFHWIKMNITSRPRMDHACSMYQDRQMLLVDGKNQLSVNSSDASCTKEYPALRLLDTSTLQWQTRYPVQDM